MEKCLIDLLHEERKLAIGVNGCEDMISEFAKLKEECLLNNDTYGVKSYDRLIGDYQDILAERKRNLASVRIEMREYFAELMG